VGGVCALIRVVVVLQCVGFEVGSREAFLDGWTGHGVLEISRKRAF